MSPSVRLSVCNNFLKRAESFTSMLLSEPLLIYTVIIFKDVLSKARLVDVVRGFPEVSGEDTFSIVLSNCYINMYNMFMGTMHFM